MKKVILDACCGSRMFHFDKKNPNVLFADNRDFEETLCDGRLLKVKPDVIHDFTDMPYENESFWHIVFDPPHLIQGGENSWLVKKYGKLPENWQEVIKKGFNECMRVLKPNGTLIFKWNETQIPVSKILKVIEYQPIYGHRSGRQNKTHWLAFVKLKN
ncbi:class I SAM-dependent methyltransferase [Pasteurella bettyae]|uniref:class I SAM-dependent methyltransferase n=1 Tax=Pasteurella bettyae TaxID=752 RepID=UPI003D29BACB